MSHKSCDPLIYHRVVYQTLCGLEMSILDHELKQRINGSNCRHCQQNGDRSPSSFWIANEIRCQQPYCKKPEFIYGVSSDSWFRRDPECENGRHYKGIKWNEIAWLNKFLRSNDELGQTGND